MELCSFGSVVRALHLQHKRLWVRFPGNTHNVKHVYPVYHCKSLWIKASAKCINVNYEGNLCVQRKKPSVC